ncbi:phospho-sugar mutase [Sporosarcina thermotolerans]|uniref:Phosphoglucomutase n=1 Tax=Sporosarcina thermotolerans TaxID=633404 RepID=A0AAW9A5H2_9BACL|nr:phospho-sugar mutase [Sporosarcina thermotolerans]MDW0116287.1 phospho-sugar mutase [Sporosarcina thermotolerans]
MQWKRRRDQWLKQLPESDSLKIELYSNLSNAKLMEDCFYKELEFGTGGMRGLMGPGTNRLNIYTVRKAAYGLSMFIKDQGEQAMSRGIVIAYDSRYMSREFALEIAKTIGHQGIQVYLYEDLRPTPLLSFAVRHLRTFAGVMITASHNPPQYNGLKVYGEDGAQLPPEDADIVVDYVKQAESEFLIEVADHEQLVEEGLLTYIGDEVDQSYINALQTIQLNTTADKGDLSIVFTALHGTGTIPAQQAFSAFGFTDVVFVEEQCIPDPNFTTVKSPNPEEAAAFELAIQYGKKNHSDLLLATDPDADRLGVAVKDGKGEYILLSGNQIGAIMINYLLEQRLNAGTLPRNGVVMKTIVTTELARAIAEKYMLETLDTLTGFKFIAEKIKEFGESKEHTFLFGFEESYGFLVSDFVRDKDAIQAAVLIAEAAAFYKSQGKSLLKIITKLYEEFGYYIEETRSVTFEGKEGTEQIDRIMGSFRESFPLILGGIRVEMIEDYKIGIATELPSGMKSQIELPEADVLKYKLEDGSWVCIRPSGTEPKCKFYFAAKGKTEEEAKERLADLEDAILQGVK